MIDEALAANIVEVALLYILQDRPFVFLLIVVVFCLLPVNW